MAAKWTDICYKPAKNIQCLTEPSVWSHAAVSGSGQKIHVARCVVCKCENGAGLARSLKTAKAGSSVSALHTTCQFALYCLRISRTCGTCEAPQMMPGGTTSSKYTRVFIKGICFHFDVLSCPVSVSASTPQTWLRALYCAVHEYSL